MGTRSCHSVRAIGQSASTQACKRLTIRREHGLFAYLLIGAFTKVLCPWRVLANEESTTATGRNVSMHVTVASASFGEHSEPTWWAQTRSSPGSDEFTCDFQGSKEPEGLIVHVSGCWLAHMEQQSYSIALTETACIILDGNCRSQIPARAYRSIESASIV